MGRFTLFAALAALTGLLLPDISQAQTAKGKKYALLVGVTEYEHASLPALKYTENDVEQLAQLLRSRTAGFHSVRVLTVTRGKNEKKDAPTAANVQRELKALLAEKTRHDTVLVAFSGHGMQLVVPDPDDKGPNKNFTFFCPTNADFANVSYSTGASDRLVNMDHLFAALARCGAGTKLVLVDACRNESKAEAARRSIDVDKVTIPRGVGAMFSCSSGQFAYETKKLEHGVFFYHILQGLQGKARNKRGDVTWDGLAEYVKDQVTEEVPTLIGGGAKQEPHVVGNLSGKSPVLDRMTEAEREYQQGLAKYFAPKGVIDHRAAAEHFKKAEKDGHDLATAFLALMYSWGEGVDRNPAIAARLARQSLVGVMREANNGDPDAQNRLGFLLGGGIGVDVQFDEAVKWHRKSAAQGCAAGQAGLAWCYESGQGVEKDESKAAELYRKAANHDFAPAKLQLGHLYWRGAGVAKDPGEAFKWFLAAAKQGERRGQVEVGLCYGDGTGVGGVDKDAAEAVKWYRKAAEQDYGRGQHFLGWHYYLGRGVKQDHKESRKWFRKAAEQGLSGSQNMLGLHYEYGLGGDKDIDEAAKWYRKSAEQGWVAGQRNLGRMCAAGSGVKKDLAEARKWLRKAADQGDKGAEEDLKKLAE